MIYETRNHWFKKDNRKIELTNVEHTFLLNLVYDQVVTYEELAKRIYGTEVDPYVMQLLRNVKCRLLKKVPINIRTVDGRGYKLKTEILFK